MEESQFYPLTVFWFEMDEISTLPHMMESARLELYLGSMFSGKTTKALQKLSEFDAMGLKCAYINHRSDIRSDKNFSTNSNLNLELPPGVTAFKVALLPEVDIAPYDVIVIDEAQFFSDLEQTIREWLKFKKYFYVVGLSGSYQREKFGQISDLVPMADAIVPFYANCKYCAVILRPPRFSDAPFTYRLTNDDNVHLVGSNDKYVALCRQHYDLMEQSKGKLHHLLA